MTTMRYIETDQFYDDLDKAVEQGQTVTIEFGEHALVKDSKLWKRLTKCQNWKRVEEELHRIASGGASPLKGALASSMVVGLTGGEIMLIAWLGSLLLGLLFYAVYKGYVIDMDGDVDPTARRLKGKLVLKPAPAS